MKKIFLLLLLSYPLFAQNPIIRRNDLDSSLYAYRIDSLGLGDTVDVGGLIKDSLDATLRLHTVSIYDFIGAYDTSLGWSLVIQSAINNSKGKNVIIPADSQYVYGLQKQEDNPYDAGIKDYCIDLGTGNINLTIMPKATLRLKDSQQTDATGAVDLLIFKNTNYLSISDGTIDANAQNQSGWTGGYSQNSGSGSIIRGYGTVSNYTVNNYLRFNDLILLNSFSNPIDISSATNVFMSNITASHYGEGIELIYCKDIMINKVISKSGEVAVGDGFELSNCENFNLSNITLEGTTAGGSNNFDLVASNYGMLTDFECGGVGLQVQGAIQSTDISINNGLIRNTALALVALQAGRMWWNNVKVVNSALGSQFVAPNYVVPGLEWEFNNCTFDSGFVLVQGEANVKFMNCVFRNSDPGLLVNASVNNIDSSKVSLIGCVFENNVKGLRFDSQGYTNFKINGIIEGCTFLNNTTDFDLGGDSLVLKNTNVKGNLLSNYNNTVSTTDIVIGIYDVIEQNYAGFADFKRLRNPPNNAEILIKFNYGGTVYDISEGSFPEYNIKLESGITETYQAGDYLKLKWNPIYARWDELYNVLTPDPNVAVEPTFTSDNPFGADRFPFNPRINNYLYSSVSRFTVSDTGFLQINKTGLFNNNYDDPSNLKAIVDTSDTGRVYINFTTKNEFGTDTVLVQTGGYVLLPFYYNFTPDTVIGQMKLKDSTNWTTFTDYEDISNDEGHSIIRLTVPTRNYAEQFRFYIIAKDTSDAYLSEIEFYPLSSDPSYQPNVNKYQENSLYNKLSFKNADNVETAWIDSTGDAEFDGLAADSLVANGNVYADNGYFTGTVQANIIVGTVASLDTVGDNFRVTNIFTSEDSARLTTVEITGTTNHHNNPITNAGRINEVDLDSLQGRVAKLDTTVFAFSITNPTGTENKYGIKILSNVTITRLDCVILSNGGANDSVAFNIKYHTDRSSGSATSLMTSDEYVSSTTTGEIITVFNDATISNGNWIWITTSAEVGDTTELIVNGRGRYD